MTPKEAMHRLPKSMRVGGHLWLIKTMTNAHAAGEQTFGKCAVVEQTIYLQEEFPSTEKLVDTFWHEVLHAIYYVWNMRDEDKEERLVGTLASAILALYTQNPWLHNWMRETLSG